MISVGAPGRQQFTLTDGILGSGSRPCRVFAVYQISGTSTAAVTILRDGLTVGATKQLQVDGTSSKGTNWADAQGLLFPNGCFVDVDVNTANVTVSYMEEV